MSRRIEVTQEDLDRATQNNSYHCAVAEAIIRQIPDSTRVMVDIQTIRYTLNDRRYVYMTPRGVWQYIIDFDAGKLLAPFSFSLQQAIWSGKRVHARGTAGYEEIEDNEGDDEEGVARVNVGTNSAVGRRTAAVLRVPAKAPPALTRRGYRVYGLRGLPMNRGSEDVPK